MADQERMLPIANVGRIMKQMLPPAAKISKEAKQTVQECVTEFVSFVTGEASERCHKENRKTVNGDDICWALSALGFDEYAGAMLRYLQRYRELERNRAASSSTMAANQPHSNDQDEPAIRRSSEELVLGIDRTCSTSFDQRQQEEARDCNAPPNTLEFRIIIEKN